MTYSPREYLQHIRDEAAYLVSQTQGLQKEQFLRDSTLLRAFVRSIEIMGEAVKRVPEDFRSRHPQIEWRAMAGMRDVLIHGYDEVDLDEVWKTAAADLVPVIGELERIADTLDDDES